ncbi:hypothetical protein DY000_02032577 [Brassica cretica]|uniref:Uncharacterized protein n=1 Tax=Brassica cretica TaxID=69181 RepID=A0ABQ7DM82_BRACR|nr:hypothetical protein DY000_02032577 [Brassica cretica]
MMQREEVVAAIPTMYTASSDSDLMTPLVIGHHRTYSMKLKSVTAGLTKLEVSQRVTRAAVFITKTAAGERSGLTKPLGEKENEIT